MAKKGPKSGKGALRGNRPRLVGADGKPLPAEEMGKNIDGWIDYSFQEELRLTAYLDVNTRRQIRLATGVGDMNSFINEFNNGLVNTMTVSTPTVDKTKKQLSENPKLRPRLRKISQEYQITYRPAKKF